MKVLITGGAGFIGSNLVAYIAGLEAGHEIVVLDDLSTGRESNLAGFPVRLIVGSVADHDSIRRGIDGVDAVVHLGALGSVPRSVNNPLGSHVANLNGTLNVLEAARGTDAYVVFASSSSVYGANLSLPKSEFDWTRPMSPYAATKLGAEAYVVAYQYSYGLPTLAFRFFNVYGPKQPADHDYAAVIPRFIDAALKGNAVTVFGDGHQSRDFTHVDSVCRALWHAVENRLVLTDPVNLAFGTSTTLLDLIDVISSEVGAPLRVEYGNARPGDVRASQSDGLRMREHFPGVEPVPLEVGIASTVNWFRSVKARS